MNSIIRVIFDKRFVYIISFLIATYFTLPILSQAQEQQRPNLHCLVFESPKLVVVTIGTFISYGSTENCNGHAETISYFLYQGYNISKITELEAYLIK